MKIEISGSQVQVLVNKAIYNIDVLHKCFYWYGANYDIDIEDFDVEQYAIRLSAKHDDALIEEIISKIKRDLIDFKLRDVVTKETKTVRELIIAKAFANYDDDTNPQTELSDPVGFDPLAI